MVRNEPVDLRPKDRVGTRKPELQNSILLWLLPALNERHSGFNLGVAKNVEDVGQRMKGLIAADDRAGKFAWKVLSHSLAYAARMVGEIASRRQEIDSLARQLVESGLALWENAGESSERLIVRGRSNLIGEVADQAEIDRIRVLFDDLERKRDIAEFLNLTEAGEGVRIFIGSENKLFSLSGSSLVVSPYMNADRKIIGAVGVIGPTRLNYGRIVPIVDYTAQLVGRLVSDRGKA